MEGVLGRGSRSHLTCGRERRSWRSERGSGCRVLAVRDIGRQKLLRSTLLTVEKTEAVGASPGSDARSSSENERGTVRLQS